ncbi:mannonate dehydratase [Mesorhizobium sp. L-8-10]|uniref:mannonate dehydratase n=1 Tax=Mesorhizobium sp. L-8-10 TaxID=2744523 RepID=UPI0019262238|nr:mannonate dehydratase [Mesorhizobium sp. L-8-10]BCH30650.1 mannonate dehydratase [Mesorhizobium sp. L-8-10]
MRQTWRWFGPHDKVNLADARQAGAEGIVTALHHVPTGETWRPEEIASRQREVAFHPDGSITHLKWEVVESLPVSEAIKTQTGAWRAHLVHYRRSLENLAQAGISVVCYNFMPVLDWTRTDLAWRVAHGGTAMRFDLVDFAAFDIHILRRKGAAEDFPEAVVAEAARRFRAMGDDRRNQLAANVTAGLPGAQEHWSLDGLSVHLATYSGIGPQKLRSHLVDFLAEVAPTAERLGLRLCCHPDDPPFPLLGLPRIMSGLDDYRHVLEAVDLPANGATLCTGSLGARPDNDLPDMVRKLAPRIHFVHLRNVKRDTDEVPCSFHEAEHLAGDTDMVAVVAALLEEERRRREEGRSDARIPMRPDHGQDILDDLKRGAQPGYPAIGRLKGLAELRGVMAAFSHPEIGL